MLLFGFGMGLNFVTLTLTAVSGVAQHEAGAASGLLNATQQVGGSLGLSILITVFGTASRDEAEKQVPEFLAEGSPEQKAEFAQTQQLPAPWGHEVLAQGISTAFIAAAAMAVLALATAWFVIRVRKSDLEALAGTAGPGRLTAGTASGSRWQTGVGTGGGRGPVRTRRGRPVRRRRRGQPKAAPRGSRRGEARAIAQHRARPP